MLATLHLLWMFAANRFKSRRRLEAENPFSPASAEYRSETCTARSAAPRERSSPVGLDDMALAKLAQLVACGSAGHNPARAEPGNPRAVRVSAQTLAIDQSCGGPPTRRGHLGCDGQPLAGQREHCPPLPHYAAANARRPQRPHCLAGVVDGVSGLVAAV